MYLVQIFIVLARLLGQMPGDMIDHIKPVDQQQLNEFRLTNGDVMRGDIASVNEDGLVLKLNVGGFSDRVPWAKFTQETLKRLSRNQQARQFVEPFIEIPPEVRARQLAKRREFHPRPVPRIAKPASEDGMIATITAPINLALLAALFLANLYVAFEVAHFRHRPIPLVCGLSALLPVLGPLIFLVLPSQAEPGYAAEPAEAALDESDAETEESVAATPGALSMSRGDRKGPAKLQPATYSRSENTFDRRFFETKFPGFFRVVLGEAEKDMVIVVKTVRGEYIAKRIARITTNEMHLQLMRGAAEVSVSFGEITQVQLRYKDAKA